MVIFAALTKTIQYGLSLSLFNPQHSFWKYQCIDTMKVSRDEARSLPGSSKLAAEVDFQVATIKSLGANCIAIGTPYDEEFIPYLKFWVRKARQNNVHVWFRGNWSSWEGWFDHKKDLTPQKHIELTRQFILSHPDLFENGDIFTPAPEAENAWPNGSAGNDKDAFRQFLIKEYQVSQNAFDQIGKNVETNWLSMSGGVAKNVLDQNTVDAIGDTVTLDHYVTDPEDMANYINYFKNNYHANVVIGEFGAPIPDLNGDMDENQQAAFVEKLLHELYVNRASIHAINYWTLTDSSTSIYSSSTHQPRKVAQVIKSYFIPAIIKGRITNPLGDPVIDVTIATTDNGSSTKTDGNGNYTIVVPAKDVTINIKQKNQPSITQTFAIAHSGEIKQDIIVEPTEKDFVYQLRWMIKEFGNKIKSMFVKK